MIPTTGGAPIDVSHVADAAPPPPSLHTYFFVRDICLNNLHHLHYLTRDYFNRDKMAVFLKFRHIFQKFRHIFPEKVKYLQALYLGKWRVLAISAIFFPTLFFPSRY